MGLPILLFIPSPLPLHSFKPFNDHLAGEKRPKGLEATPITACKMGKMTDNAQGRREGAHHFFLHPPHPLTFPPAPHPLLLACSRALTAL